MLQILLEEFFFSFNTRQDTSTKPTYTQIKQALKQIYVS
jgi:hypothetical protein